MPPTAKPRQRRQLCLLGLLFLTLAAAWTWRLWPRQAATDELGQVRITQLERVARFLAKAPAEVVQPILASLAAVSDEQLEVLDIWVQKSPAQQLRELTVQNSIKLTSVLSRISRHPNRLRALPRLPPPDIRDAR